MEQKVARLTVSPGNIPSDFTVNISGLCCRDWVGVVKHVFTGRVHPFAAAFEALLFIQEQIEAAGYPQPTTAPRSWGKIVGSSYITCERLPFKQPVEELFAALKCEVSFFIRIHYRQNASWQGSIEWLGQNRILYFRSFLELLNLMQEAVESSVVWEDPQPPG